ncbi:MAG TPA: glycosyltransferase family 2 protein [Candidatus Kryptonia bacterium]|nr:glycosyltransferase family 2 protein [Candidatus Kryptonia bacterium]
MRCSIIVPTYNRAASLRRCLATLIRQDYDDYEVIVVDDASTDETAATVQREFPRCRYLRLERRGGSTRARNRAMPLATGSLVMFTDDDCIAPITWLRTHAAHYADAHVAAVGGPLMPATPSFCDKFYSAHYREEFEVLRRIERLLGWERLVTGNMSVRRAAFERAGGFDERMPRGADADLVRRIIRAGYAVIADPATGVEHLKTYTLRSFLVERYYKSCGSVMTDVKEGTLRARRFVPLLNVVGAWRDWQNFRTMYGSSIGAFAAFWTLAWINRWVEVAGRAYYYWTVGRFYPASERSS